MMGAPQYLRRAKFINNTGTQVVVKLGLKSGTTEDCSLAAGASRDYEKEIDKGSWTEVDPINKITIEAEGHTAHEIPVQTSGVEIHEYALSVSEGNLAADK